MSRCCSEGYGSLGQFNDDPCLSGIYIWCYYLCWMVKVMFSSLLVYKLVCLFVCLLATLWKNAWTDFHEIFRICWLMIQGTIWKLWRVVCLTPCIQGFFSYFFRNPCLWATLWKNGWMDFHEIFRKVGNETRKNLKHFWDVAIKSLDPGSIFLFSGSLFVSNIMEIRLNGFSCNFHDATQEVYI